MSDRDSGLTPSEGAAGWSADSKSARGDDYSIHPGYTRALIGVVAAAAIAVSASFSGSILAFVIAIIGGLVIMGWPRLMDLPNKTAPYPILIFTLIASIGVAFFGDRDHFAILAAGALIGTFVTEMFRRDGGVHHVEQLSGTFLGVMLMIAVGMWIPVVRVEHGPELIICMAIVIAVVSLVHAFDSTISSALGLINGIITGLATAWVMRVPLPVGLVVGIAVALVYFVSQRGVENKVRHSLNRAELSRALAPLCALGAVAFIICETMF